MKSIKRDDNEIYSRERCVDCPKFLHVGSIYRNTKRCVSCNNKFQWKIRIQKKKQMQKEMKKEKQERNMITKNEE